MGAGPGRDEGAVRADECRGERMKRRVLRRGSPGGRMHGWVVRAALRDRGSRRDGTGYRGEWTEQRGEGTRGRDERTGRRSGAAASRERTERRGEDAACRDQRAAWRRVGRTVWRRSGRTGRWPSGRTGWHGGRGRWWLPLLVSLALAVLGAPGARASAPTAVAARADTPDMALVVAGGTGHTTLVHSGDRDFARLWRLLAPRFTGTERVPDAWAAGDYPPVRATVIWGMTGVGGGRRRAGHPAETSPSSVRTRSSSPRTAPPGCGRTPRRTWRTTTSAGTGRRARCSTGWWSTGARSARGPRRCPRRRGAPVRPCARSGR